MQKIIVKICFCFLFLFIFFYKPQTIFAQQVCTDWGTPYCIRRNPPPDSSCAVWQTPCNQWGGVANCNSGYYSCSTGCCPICGGGVCVTPPPGGGGPGNNNGSSCTNGTVRKCGSPPVVDCVNNGGQCSFPKQYAGWQSGDLPPKQSPHRWGIAHLHWRTAQVSSRRTHLPWYGLSRTVPGGRSSQRHWEQFSI